MTAVLPAPTTPQFLPVSAARTEMSLSDKVALSRGKYRRAFKIPPTVIQQRETEEALKLRRAERPAIFTAQFVRELGSATVAKLLNDCWYDLVDLERR